MMNGLTSSDEATNGKPLEPSPPPEHWGGSVEEGFWVSEAGSAAEVVANPSTAHGHVPSVIANEFEIKDFQVRSASVRGLLHEMQQKPRQDEHIVVYLAESNRIVAIVADGVSAGEESHLAALNCSRWLLSEIEALKELPDTEGWNRIRSTVGKRLISQGLKRLEKQGERPDGKPYDGSDVEKLMSTTLASMVIELDTNQLTCVNFAGDSSAFSFNNDKWESIFQGKDGDSALHATAVASIMRPGNVEVRRISLWKEPELLLLMTDGVGDPFIDGNTLTGRFLKEKWVRKPPNLPSFISGCSFSSKSFDDDRTVVAIWKPETKHGANQT